MDNTLHKVIRNTLTLFLWGITAIIWLSSCDGLLPGSRSPSLIPTEQLPTVIAMTVEAMMQNNTTENSQSPTDTPIPTPSLTPEIPASLTPTPLLKTNETKATSNNSSPTATPLPPPEIPYAEIQFLSPGALSKVVSPIRLQAFLLPGDMGRATVELFGEDGRLMYRQLFIFSTPVDIQKNLRTDIDFEIPGLAETAMLVISTDDSYGRVKEIASVKLILLSLGDSDLTPGGDHLAPIVIQEPKTKVFVQGEKLLVSGLVRTSSDQPLLVELVTTEGKVIGSRLAGIVPGGVGDHRLFAAEVPFSVDSPTWVRVTISERENGNPKPLQLSSVEVLLSP